MANEADPDEKIRIYSVCKKYLPWSTGLKGLTLIPSANFRIQRKTGRHCQPMSTGK